MEGGEDRRMRNRRGREEEGKGGRGEGRGREEEEERVGGRRVKMAGLAGVSRRRRRKGKKKGGGEGERRANLTWRASRLLDVESCQTRDKIQEEKCPRGTRVAGGIKTA